MLMIRASLELNARPNSAADYRGGTDGKDYTR
jgi:hypothetical protein